METYQDQYWSHNIVVINIRTHRYELNWKSFVSSLQNKKRKKINKLLIEVVINHLIKHQGVDNKNNRKKKCCVSNLVACTLKLILVIKASNNKIFIQPITSMSFANKSWFIYLKKLCSYFWFPEDNQLTWLCFH